MNICITRSIIVDVGHPILVRLVLSFASHPKSKKNNLTEGGALESHADGIQRNMRAAASMNPYELIPIGKARSVVNRE